MTRKFRWLPLLLLGPMTIFVRGGQEPLIRANVHVVQVSIVATGSHGAPARGLDIADFRVWDNGKEQTISSLELFSSRTDAGPANLPPNTYSNRFGQAGKPQVLSMILLDAVNTKFRYQQVAQKAVESILAQLQPGQRVALYTFGAKLRTLHDFSSDQQSLLAQLKNYHGELTDHDDALPDYRLPMTNPPSPFRKAVVDKDRIVNSFSAMEALANRVKGIPGRKNLLWIGESFPLLVQGTRLEKEMNRAMAALNDASVSVYPVDMRGVRIVRGSPAAEAVEKIADATGGKAYLGRNDLDRGVRLALDDTREVYLLNYTPDNIAADGAYHRIRVQTSRRGVDLRSRQGYYAPGRAEDSREGAGDRMPGALSSPLDASEIGIQAGVESDDGIKLVIHIDPADINLILNSGKWTGALRLEAIQTGASGESFGGVRQLAEINLETASYQRALQEGLRFEMKLPRNPAVSVRIGVIDDPGGHVGSLSIPLAH